MSWLMLCWAAGAIGAYACRGTGDSRELLALPRAVKAFVTVEEIGGNKGPLPFV